MKHDAVILRNLYIIMACLCYFMVVWVFVAPGTMFHEHFHRFRDGVMKVLPNPLSSDIITKYYGQRAVHATHLLPGAIWCSIAPLQFHTQFRKGNWVLHRWLGYVLLLCVVFQCVGIAIIMQRGLLVKNFYQDVPNDPLIEYSNPVVVVISVWYATTAAVSLWHAKQRQFLDHRLALIRHVALGSLVATQRIFIIVVPGPISRRAQRNLFIYTLYAAIGIHVVAGEVACFLYEAKKRKKQK